MKSFFAYGIVPIACVFFGVGVYMVASGVPLAGKTLPFIVACSVLFLAIELWKPFHRGSYQAKRVVVDLSFSFINKVVVSAMWGSFFIPLSMKLTGAAEFGDMAFWQDYMPLWVEVILAGLLVEFMRYWAHRAQHRIPVLWRFHSFHHSQGNPYILNVYTNHPIDDLVRGTIPYFLLLPLGVSLEAFFLTFCFLLATGVHTHSNADFRNARWVNRLFPTNELHRWHHSTDVAEGDRNFGTGLIVFDRLFGTYYLPEDRRAPEKYGVEAEAQPRWDPLAKLRIDPVETRSLSSTEQ